MFSVDVSLITRGCCSSVACSWVGDANPIIEFIAIAFGSNRSISRCAAALVITSVARRVITAGRGLDRPATYCSRRSSASRSRGVSGVGGFFMCRPTRPARRCVGLTTTAGARLDDPLRFDHEPCKLLILLFSEAKHSIV